MPFQRCIQHINQPVVSLDRAMSAFERVVHRESSFETAALFLDHDCRIRTAIVVADTARPEQVVDVAETLAYAAQAHPDLYGAVFASVRPYGQVLPGDADLWFDIEDHIHSAGLVLLDWIVVGRFGAQSTREMLGLASRWST